MSDLFQIKENTAGITDVPGFLAEGVACDIRQNASKQLDLALIYSEKPCSAAGVFTQNDIKAAPVRLCQSTLSHAHSVHAIVANSGNANACTGDQGKKDAESMASITAAHCKLEESNVFVCSTGRIGRQLPMQAITDGIDMAAQQLGSSEDHGKRAATAILTSDTCPKTVTATIEYEGKTVTLAGIAKGAGMIEPNMATMLAFIATDIQIPSPLLQKALHSANQSSFNAITIDGDMSTNDSVLILANGHSGIEITNETGPLYQKWLQALQGVCEQLAKKIVLDGERVTKCVTLKVEGAPTNDDAQRIARAVGNSLLVKTSWYGNDPNWGRIIDAAGYARVGIVEEKLDILYNDCTIFEKGNALDQNLSQCAAIVKQPEFQITIHLNSGHGKFKLLSTDLSEGYVDFNKSE